MKTIESNVCPQCGRRMSNFSAKHFGVCNGCKDRNRAIEELID